MLFFSDECIVDTLLCLLPAFRGSCVVSDTGCEVESSRCVFPAFSGFCLVFKTTPGRLCNRVDGAAGR